MPHTYTVDDPVICVRADSNYAGQVGQFMRTRHTAAGAMHTVRWPDEATPTYRDDSIRPAPKPVASFQRNVSRPSPSKTTTTYQVPAGTRNYRLV